MMTSSK